MTAHDAMRKLAPGVDLSSVLGSPGGDVTLVLM